MHHGRSGSRPASGSHFDYRGRGHLASQRGLNDCRSDRRRDPLDGYPRRSDSLGGDFRVPCAGMTDSTLRRLRLRKTLLWLVIAVGVGILAFVAASAIHIVHAADLQQTQHADAIIVFGAAEYSGRPSPVYRARLDHAFDLYKLGL